MSIYEEMMGAFTKWFGSPAHTPRFFFTPGRVNLIGEHTDYNGGHVFPCALNMGTYALALPRQVAPGEPRFRIYSGNVSHEGRISFSLDSPPLEAPNSWSRYPRGVLAVLAEHGYLPEHAGMDILYYGTLPGGSGLSSSASIEVLTAFVASTLFSLPLNGIQRATLAQEAENTHVGVQCGIMDQFAVSMGQKDHAILLQCNTLEYRQCPLPSQGVALVVTNTNKPHSLASSEYNIRRQECETALKNLQTRLDIRHLCDLDVATFEANADAIPDATAALRARHAVLENQRAIAAAKCLASGDLSGFGALMRASHISLRDDFAVSCRELDVLAELAWQQEGVWGSRMTGGGFGGCTVSLVAEEAVSGFIDAVGSGYAEQIGYEPSFYVTGTDDGARELPGGSV